MLISRAVLLTHQLKSAMSPISKDGGTHPGSLSVLFIENAKCFPSDVKSSGR